jgi:hypothetical protein
MATDALTHEEFARLRSAAEHARRLRLNGRGTTLPLPPDGIIEFCRQLPEPITHHAGEWVREDRLLSTGDPTRWHQFTGDLTWHYFARHVAAGIGCQVRSVNYNLLWSIDKPEDGVCKWCAR